MQSYSNTLLREAKYTNVLSVTGQGELSHLCGSLPGHTQLGTFYGIFPGGKVCSFYWTKCRAWAIQTRLERVGDELGLVGLSSLTLRQDIAFLVSHTFKTFLKNGYNSLYHKAKLKMEQNLGGVAIPQLKTFTFKLTGWSEQGIPCQACLSWLTGLAGERGGPLWPQN